MCTISSRIVKISENEGIRIAELERKIGSSKGVLYKAIANKTDIQSKWIARLVEIFPIYSAEWLLTGKGEMLKENNIQQPFSSEPKHSASTTSIPLIHLYEVSEFLSGNDLKSKESTDYYTIPSLMLADFLIAFPGDSMAPTFHSGDIVACKRIPSDSFFQWNRVYLLDTDQGPLIKRIHKGSTPSTILLVSDNEVYEPFELAVEKIQSVAIVIGGLWIE